MRIRSTTAVVAVAVTIGSALSVAAAPAQAAATVTGGSYHTVTSSRILDTRSGIGAPAGSRGPGSVTSFPVLGRSGVPATGVGAVVVNLTAVSPTSGTYVSAYPAGSSVPNVSSINVEPGVTRANQVTVPVGGSGQVSLYNAFGSLHLLVDVLGYYDATGTAGGLIQVEPTRIYDSRGVGRIPSGDIDAAGLTFDDPAIDPHITSLAVNITVINADTGGYLSVWDGVNLTGDTSTVNFGAHDNVPNAAVVPAGHDIQEGTDYSYFLFGNASDGDIDVAVDVVGVYVDAGGPAALKFVPVTPQRVVDTRSGLGGFGRLGEGDTESGSIPASIGGATAEAYAANTTAVSPSSSTFVTVWFAGGQQPGTSTLNANAHQTVANAAIVDADFRVFNAYGSTDFLLDVAGAFVDPPAPAAGARAKSVTPKLQPATRGSLPVPQKLTHP